jgi:hypothetical protein
MILRQQEQDEQTPRVPLMLLRTSIASDGGESSLYGGYLCALGFGSCGTKFDEHGVLYIWLFR